MKEAPAGIYGTVGPNTRGRFDLQSGTEVTNTGKNGTTPISTFHHSGVHMYNDQGYLALEADGLVSGGNVGSGVSLNSPSTLANDTKVPMGTYLSLEDCRIHQNGREGLWLRCGLEWANQPGHSEQAIVGGTWDNYDMSSGSLSFIDYGYEPFYQEAAIRSGQGKVNRCSISNNGEHGVLLEIRGNSEPGSGNYAAIPVRFTNDFIWNNSKGEFYGDVETVGSPSGNGPYFLAPITHSTLVGPDNGNAYTFEVTESQAGSTAYSRGEVQTLGGGKFLRARLYNSIFQRGPSGGAHDDFGTDILGELVFDDPNVTLTVDKLGAAGMRMKHSVIVGADSYSIDDVAPWIGPVVLSSFYPDQFYLQSSAVSGFKNSPPWLTVDIPSSELKFDYLNVQRPALLTEHDKGAKEIQ